MVTTENPSGWHISCSVRFLAHQRAECTDCATSNAGVRIPGLNHQPSVTLITLLYRWFTAARLPGNRYLNLESRKWTIKVIENEEGRTTVSFLHVLQALNLEFTLISVLLQPQWCCWLWLEESITQQHGLNNGLPENNKENKGDLMVKTK